jgi:CheY-like chemotaxis protein
MDHMMPDMDGLETTAGIRALEGCKNLPVVMLTANAVTGRREMFLANGVDDFLPKPIELPRLDKILQKWLPDKKKIEMPGAGPAVAANQLYIQGLDIDEGLRNTGGNLSIYVDILEEFCRNADEKKEKLRNALAKEDMELYATLAHALRGGASAIGAKPFAAFAARMEEAGSHKDRQAVAKRTKDFLRYLDLLTGNIRAALQQNKPQGGQAGGLRLLKMDVLRAALCNMQIDVVNDLLLEYTFLPLDKGSKDEVAEIEKNVLLFEYEKAIEKIDQILKKYGQDKIGEGSTCH